MPGDDLALSVLAKVIAAANRPWIGENLIRLKTVDVELTDAEVELVRTLVAEEDSEEKWTVVDKWWTGNPIRRDYRSYVKDGEVVTEFREGDEEWRIYP